jgi:photosynthetic reaction center cytochrome c subunit
MKLGISITLIIGLFLTIAMLFTAGWERPPMDSTQVGYRGLGMVEIDNPRREAARDAHNRLPEVVPAVPAGGPAATSVYKNVQALNDLSVGEFTRLMVAMTAWVSPQEGCNYCHNPNDLAAEVSTKVVARRMIQMTRHINADWKNHVAGTGVTCFTCHRGQPVPSNIWYADASGMHASRFAGNRAGQNAPARTVGLTSLPVDPFSRYLGKRGGDEIRVQSTAALPAGHAASIQHTEATYGLMMHISQSLGANCTFCHNTRSFFDWDASTPQRTAAWHGIRMVRDLNANYLEPLAGKYPDGRMGPLGDAPKLNCATCHQGEHKPLRGASMLKDYPAFAAVGKVAAAAPTPAPVVVGETVIIYFAVDSAALDDAAPKTLEMLVVKLRANPRAKATVSGYHSATGDAAHNHELAKNRALSVQAALKAAGIGEDRVVLEKPLVEQANVAGEDPKARRVVVVVR